jgi:hypothetical protein
MESIQEYCYFWKSCSDYIRLFFLKDVLRTLCILCKIYDLEHLQKRITAAFANANSIK